MASTFIKLPVSGGSGPAPNIDLEYKIFADFDGPTAALTGSPLQLSQAGAGATVVMSSTFGVDATQQAIGVAEFQNGTVANGRSFWRGSSNAYSLDTTWNHYFKARVAVSSLGTVTDPFVVRIGYGDLATASLPNDGAYFLFTADGVSTTWQCETSQTAIRTNFVSSVALTVGVFQIFEIFLNATSAQFLIDGALVTTLNTNLPEAGQRFGPEGIIFKTTLGTGVGASMYVDYVYYSASRTGAR